MGRLREAISLKRVELWKNHLWILHHDNALNATTIMPQTQYSQDLAPADFILFPKLRTPIKGKHFATIEEIKEKLKQERFQKCFEDWKK